MEVSARGYGSGNGNGNGYGNGYGYGYGDGNGYGYGEYIAALISAGCPAAAKAEKAGAALAFWRSRPDGRPANGGTGEARKAGDVEEIAGPLELCSRNALHGTLQPRKWRGEKLWAVALYPPYEQEDDKIGSLKREILCEMKDMDWLLG